MWMKMRLLPLLLSPQVVLPTTFSSFSHLVVVVVAIAKCSKSYNINIKLLYKYEVALLPSLWGVQQLRVGVALVLYFWHKAR